MLYAGAVVSKSRLAMKIDKVAGRKEPLWKIRLKNKIKELRKEGIFPSNFLQPVNSSKNSILNCVIKLSLIELHMKL